MAGSSPVEIGNMFVKHYYNLFDTDVSKLESLYQDISMLTFEGAELQGARAIIGKFTGMGFKTIAHKVNTVDVQPGGVEGSILVFVSGALLIDDSENPVMFAQTFHLLPDAETGNYWILNDIFRLSYVQ